MCLDKAYTDSEYLGYGDAERHEQLVWVISKYYSFLSYSKMVRVKFNDDFILSRGLNVSINECLYKSYGGFTPSAITPPLIRSQLE